MSDTKEGTVGQIDVIAEIQATIPLRTDIPGPESTCAVRNGIRCTSTLSQSGRLRAGALSRAPSPFCTFPMCRTSSHCCRSVTYVRVESLQDTPPRSE